MTDNSKEFKEGLKATSLFGGVKVVSILIGIIRSKFVAILLGPDGMGLNSMLTSTTQMINAFTGFGLGTSAVKDISEANALNNQERISKTISAFRKLVVFTGSLGFLLCLVLSPVLSRISFGSYEYVIAFASISITLLFMQLSDGQRALLQGTRHFRYLAYAGIWGSILGLFTVIPLYYFLGLRGVVPGIIVASLTTLCLTWYYARKVSYTKTSVTIKEAFFEGRGMLKMGFFLSLQTLLSYLMAYVLRLFINHFGGLSDVGLFGAGFAIVDMYVGMVFSAMATEYYPRLASHCSDSAKVFNSAINQQIEISQIIISPLICLYLIFGNIAIVLLYSEKFLPITMMVNISMLGTMFKAPSWCISFSFMAKGDSKPYLINEVLAILISSALKMVLFYYWGLTGIGVAYLLSYILYFLQVTIVCSIRYQYKYDRRMLLSFVPQFMLAIACFLIFLCAGNMIKYTIGGAVVLLSFFLSYRDLNKYVDVGQYIKGLIKR